MDHDSRLRQLRTDFDPVPLVGQFARGVARSQYQRHQPAADAEVQQKLAARVEERVDREATERLTEFGHRLHEKVLGPIEALLLDPTLVAAETTQQRAIMRVRLAGHDQLGAHTPRPQAPGDSLFSVQIHESLLNNVLGRLDLEGQTFTLAELETRIAERLHRPQPKACDPDQEDVKITFAAQNALRLRCAGGPGGDPGSGQAEQVAAALEGLPGPCLLPPRYPRALDRAGAGRRGAAHGVAAHHGLAIGPAGRLLESVLAEIALAGHASRSGHQPQSSRAGRSRSSRSTTAGSRWPWAPSGQPPDRPDCEDSGGSQNGTTHPFGPIRSLPTHARSTSGTTIEPSACW